MKKSLLYLFTFLLLTSCGTDYDKTISTNDLTKGSWWMETSDLKEFLDDYMKSNGYYDITRRLEFNGDGKSGTVNFYESINGGQSCTMNGTYQTDSSNGSLKIRISGLENNNGYCSYYNQLNGLYEYKYVLYSDIDSRFQNSYPGMKTLTLWKEGTRKIIFQKDKK